MSGAQGNFSDSVPAETNSNGFTYPNGSCLPPKHIPPEQLNPDALLAQRFLLRIPMWIFSACSLYIAVIVAINTWKKAKSGEVENRNVSALKYGLLLASWVTTINLSYFSFAIYVELGHAISCSSWYKLENALYWTNISILYTVLWLRQRVVYSQRLLREAVSKMTSFFSNAIIVMVIMLPIMNAVVFATGMMYCFDELAHLCLLAVKRETVYFVTLTVVELSVPIFLPLTLLGLFAWPLIRYHLRSRQTGAVAGQRSLIGMLWRICVATALCLATDVGAMLCNERCAIYVAPTLRHFSLFCNLVCVVLSFAEWRKILFPMFPEKWNSLFNSASTSTSVTSSL